MDLGKRNALGYVCTSVMRSKCSSPVIEGDSICGHFIKSCTHPMNRGGAIIFISPIDCKAKVVCFGGAKR